MRGTDSIPKNNESILEKQYFKTDEYNFIFQNQL